MACSMDCWVPTASTTLCAPSPLVRSFTRETPSSPRSSTMSVAPNSLASAWRCGLRDIAMTRSAPNSLAARIARRPTAPSPTTATVLPGPASAATAPNQPVPSTSEAASSEASTSGSSGRPPGTTTRVPSACGMRTNSAWVPLTNPPLTQRDW